MARASFTLGGLDDLQRTFRDISDAVGNGGFEALHELATDVMEESKARAPEDELHQLVDSHRLVVVEHTPTRSVIDIRVGPVFGKNGFDYTLAMHEGHPQVGKYKLGRLSLTKSRGPAHSGPGVGLKFLERAFDAAYSSAVKRIAEAVKAAMGSRTK